MNTKTLRLLSYKLESGGIRSSYGQRKAQQCQCSIFYVLFDLPPNTHPLSLAILTSPRTVYFQRNHSVGLTVTVEWSASILCPLFHSKQDL